jgi:hypothetical protein
MPHQRSGVALYCLGVDRAPYFVPVSPAQLPEQEDSSEDPPFWMIGSVPIILKRPPEPIALNGIESSSKNEVRRK